MSDSREQAQFREHLREMRRAATGLGSDFAREFSDLDTKIERLGRATAQEARNLGVEIQDDFSRVGRRMDDEMRRIPQRLASAGAAIGSGAARAAGATRDAVLFAGKKAKNGTRNALAAAAGVKRTPIREWSPPASGESSDRPRERPGA